MAKELKMAFCHPSKKACSKEGLCHTCYQKSVTPSIVGKGIKFGRLLVGERANPTKKRDTTWHCVCDCGKALVLAAWELRNGRLKSCGCLRHEQLRFLVDNRLRPYEALYNLFRRTSDERDKDSTISYEDFVELTVTDTCHYCHTSVVWAQHRTDLNGSGYNLDRIDNTRGYHKDNIVVCCSRCNMSRGNRFTYDEWMQAMTFLRERKTCGNT